METKDFFLIGVCIVAAIILFVKMAKENKVFIGAGILFLLYGGYHAASVLLDSGAVNVLSWILRGIAVIMLIWMFTVFSQEKAKTKAAAGTESEAAASETENTEGEVSDVPDQE